MSKSLPLAPGSTIGILGGGQLGRMLSGAAAQLGFDVAILTPRENAPDARVSAHRIVSAYDDLGGLQALADLSDVVTFEFENVPSKALEALSAMGCDVAPGPKALAFTQDRVEEKRFLGDCGVATVAFEAIQTADEIAPALAGTHAPALLKTRREGYDGKGQAWVHDASDAARAFAAIGAKPAILEARAEFVRELSIIAARGRDGDIACYPVGENRHADGILRLTTAPAKDWRDVQPRAETIARKILDGLDYIGVLGVELFELEDGRLLVNEIAPRVHNTGHWTMDGCGCSQFEQHIRAIAGWPLGPTTAHARIEMENLIGPDTERWLAIANEPDARLHLYGKGQARAGRKMGHVNRIRRLD
ncbi:MAG TPA: 5-(carboxyamino)imidazole ribonucleotide synthase [Caulobacteraceae bacterium]|jgi:5-(carboxyamino)imidazole ribonucleotide synthase|nr:5-(carboxyamino)imidazole ribonucleotide synthase [Caulobacteraceae bacterium]